MKDKIKTIIKAVNAVQIIEGAFTLACLAWTVSRLIPKYETFPGVDPEKLIENVNSKHLERCGGGEEDGI